MPSLLLLLASLGSQAQQCAADPRALTNLGATQQSGINFSPGKRETIRLRDPAEPALRYARLLLSIEAKADTPWRVIVRDHELRPIAVVHAAGAARNLWTARLKVNRGSVIYLELEAAPDTRGRVVESILMPEKAKDTYYSLRGAIPTYVPIYTADSQWRGLGDHVGFIMGHFASSTWCCTAVAIDKNHVMTNWHCGGEKVLPNAGVWSQAVCDRTIFDFSWDGDEQDREFVCEGVEQLDPEADVAILRVRPLNRPQDVLIPVRRRADDLENGDALRVVHHPACLQKQISVDCKVELWKPDGSGTVKPGDFAYRCDTENGSSGAPVFDQHGRMVGLHHLGYERDSKGVCDGLNKGVRMDSLLKFLKLGSS